MQTESGSQSEAVSLEVLRGLPLFAGLADTKLQAIIGLARLEDVGAGEPVLRQGGPATEVRVVVAGKCRLALELAGNRKQHLMTVTHGDIIGWSALLDRATWLLSAVALKPSTLLVIEGASLRALCESDHEVGYHIMRNLFSAVASRLQETRLQLIDMYGHE